MKTGITLIFLTLSLFTNLLYADAVLNIDQPVRNLKVSSDQMKNAIVSAAEEQRWIITTEGEGRMSATYHRSNYMAKISIRYAPTFYTINYADSKRLRYTGTSIHPTYNKLIKALQMNIIRNLKSGDFTEKSDAEMVTTPIDGEDDVRTKLIDLKQLYEEGLISQDEYDAKRKAIIDSY